MKYITDIDVVMIGEKQDARYQRQYDPKEKTVFWNILEVITHICLQQHRRKILSRMNRWERRTSGTLTESTLGMKRRSIVLKSMILR